MRQQAPQFTPLFVFAYNFNWILIEIMTIPNYPELGLTEPNRTEPRWAIVFLTAVLCLSSRAIISAAVSAVCQGVARQVGVVPGGHLRGGGANTMADHLAY